MREKEGGDGEDVQQDQRNGRQEPGRCRQRSGGDETDQEGDEGRDERMPHGARKANGAPAGAGA